MDDLFKRRMWMLGSTTGQSMRKKSDAIMSKTFANTIEGCMCRLYDWNKVFLEEIPAKFICTTEYSITGNQVEYKVQFLPHFHPEKKYIDESLPINQPRLGFYIEIPDDDGDYQTWLIIGRNDKFQFIYYNILKCNWEFKWVVDNEIHKCWGVLRNSGNSGSGTSTDSYTTTVDGQIQMFLPSNKDTYTITYDQRFVITTNPIHPEVFSVSKKESASFIGCLKFTMSQVQEKDTDSVDNMIADYDKSKVEPTEKPVQPIDGYSIITGAVAIKCGGFEKKYTATFYNASNVLMSDIVPIWSTDVPIELQDKILVSTINNELRIRSIKDFALIGTVITITCSDALNGYISTKKVEVISL